MKMVTRVLRKVLSPKTTTFVINIVYIFLERSGNKKQKIQVPKHIMNYRKNIGKLLQSSDVHAEKD